MVSEFIVEPQFYQENNPDLLPAGIDTPEELLTHWQLFGRFEERASSPFYEELLEGIVSFSERPTTESSEGDGGFFLPEFFSPNVTINQVGDPRRLPFAGQFFGFDGVEEYVAGLGRTLSLTEQKPLEFLKEGNRLAVRLRQEGQLADTGEDFEIDVVHLLTLDDNGLISSLESFSNTYPLNEGLAGLTPRPLAEGDLTGNPQPINPTVNSEQSRELAESFWESLAVGKTDEAFATLSDNVTWSFVSESDRDFLPYAGVFQGNDPTFREGTALQGSLGALFSMVVAGRITVLESFAEGNRVLVRLQEEGATVRKTGNSYTPDILSWFTISDDGQEIESVQTIVDTDLTVQNLRPETNLVGSGAPPEGEQPLPPGLYPFPPEERALPPYFLTPTRNTGAGSGALFSYDEDGNFLGVFGEANSDDTPELTSPIAVTTGPDGDVYVTEAPLDPTQQQAVLRFDGVSGEFRGVFGEASSQGSLIDPTTGLPTDDPSIGVNVLIGPAGIKFGPNGDLYVATGLTSQILRYDGQTGEFKGIFASRNNGFPNNTFIPGPETGTFPDFTVMEFGPDGNIYVASIRTDVDGDDGGGLGPGPSGAILRFAGPNSENPGAPLGLGEFAELGVFGDANDAGDILKEASALAFGPDLDLYVNSAATGQVLRYAGPFASNPGEFLGVAAEVSSNVIADKPFEEPENNLVLTGMGFGPEGNLYVSTFTAEETEQGRSLPIRGQVSLFAGPNSSNPGAFLGPFGDASNEGSNLRFPLTPEFLYFENSFDEVNTPNQRFPRPSFLVGSNVNPNGLFQSDEGDAIAAFDENGAFIGFWNQFSGADNPIDGIGGLKFGPNGNLLVASQLTNEIQEYDALTGQLLGVFGDASNQGSGLDFPAGIVVGPDNNIYVSSLESEQILKYDGLTGQFLGVFAEGNRTDSLEERLTALAFGPDGNLYAGFNPDPNNPNLGQAQVLILSGTTGEQIGSIPGLDFVSTVGFDADGVLYLTNVPATITDFSDPANPQSLFPDAESTVVRYDTVTNEILNSYPVGVGSATGLNFSADGQVYISNGSTGVVNVFDRENGNQLGTIEVPTITGDAAGPTAIVFLNSELQSPILQGTPGLAGEETFPVQ